MPDLWKMLSNLNTCILCMAFLDIALFGTDIATLCIDITCVFSNAMLNCLVLEAFLQTYFNNIKTVFILRPFHCTCTIDRTALIY